MAQQVMKTALQIRALLTPAQVGKVADTHMKMKALHEQERQLFQEDREEGGVIPER
jgi:hypothetical protein